MDSVKFVFLSSASPVVSQGSEGDLPKFWEPVCAPGFAAGAPCVHATPSQAAGPPAPPEAHVQGLPRPVWGLCTAPACARPSRAEECVGALPLSPCTSPSPAFPFKLVGWSVFAPAAIHCLRQLRVRRLPPILLSLDGVPWRNGGSYQVSPRSRLVKTAQQEGLPGTARHLSGSGLHGPSSVLPPPVAARCWFSGLPWRWGGRWRYPTLTVPTNTRVLFPNTRSTWQVWGSFPEV